MGDIVTFGQVYGHIYYPRVKVHETNCHPATHFGFGLTFRISNLIFQFRDVLPIPLPSD